MSMLTFFIIIFIFCIAFYLYRRQKLKFFEKLGIKGPAPHFLFGNLIEYRNTIFPKLLQKWEKEYGKVYGFFEGSTPVMVISDPDLLQEIMVKQFSNFHSRKLFPMQLDPDKDEKASMFLARGKRWKRMRTTVNPAFSENKMRRMYPMIDECIQSLISILKKEVSNESKEMEIQGPFQRMTMDIICKCAFGVQTNCQINIDHPFIMALKRFLTGLNFSSVKAVFVLTFPEIRNLIIRFFMAINKRPENNADIKIIRKKMIEVIEARKNNQDKRPDLLQFLLDSEIPGKDIFDEDNLCPMNHMSSLIKDEVDPVDLIDKPNPANSKNNPKPLTTEEVIAQATLFLIAGYETSSTALSFTMSLLTEHPEIQRKLILEIDKTFQDQDWETMTPLQFYDSIAKLPYLTAVIFEVLRFHPFGSIVINRLCLASKGTHLSNGLFISEGQIIIPNVYSIHFDEELWTGTNPQIFFPERFLEWNGKEYEFIGPPHPLAWLPFGAGPRNCIGQRFAMMAIKSSIVRFFHEFTISTSGKTEYPLELRVGATVSPKNGVHIKVIKRSHRSPEEGSLQRGL